MKSKFLKMAVGLSALVLLSGCASYVWTSSVPENMRTISVPTMRNESELTELGSVMTRQLLREIQREGTFKIRQAGDSALEVQGTVKSVSYGTGGYDRRSGLRTISFDCTAVVEVSVVDKVNGRVLIDNRKYTAVTSFVSSQDRMTAARDASGRLAEDLSTQVVDDLLNIKWKDQRK